jgi:hypothetical protein
MVISLPSPVCSNSVRAYDQSLTPQALRLLSKETVTLRNDPPEGVRIVVDEEDLTAVEGWVQGPGKTYNLFQVVCRSPWRMGNAANFHRWNTVRRRVFQDKIRLWTRVPKPPTEM